MAFWSEWRDSNARPLAPKASALPLGYTRIFFSFCCGFQGLFRCFFCLWLGMWSEANTTDWQRPVFPVLPALFASLFERFGFPYELPNHALYQLSYTRISSEESRSIPFPRFAKEPRKLHIRSFLLPLPIKPASPGFDREPCFSEHAVPRKA